MNTAQNKTSGLVRKPLKKGRKPILRKSPRSISYENFRSLKAVKDRDSQGLILCQDYKIGLPACRSRVPTPDLHHTKGRDGNLLFDERWLVWLVRSCHDKAHDNNTNSPSTKAPNDPARQMEPTPQRDAILAVQKQSYAPGARITGRTVYSSVQRRNAEFVERKKEGAI
jgi:hypothetical protein